MNLDPFASEMALDRPVETLHSASSPSKSSKHAAPLPETVMGKRGTVELSYGLTSNLPTGCVGKSRPDTEIGK